MSLCLHQQVFYMSKLIIAGSRNCSNYLLVAHESLRFIIKHKLGIPTIVSGTADGADKLGEKFANQYGLSVERCPANWDRYGKMAGMIRNRKMAMIATHCIVFWDGYSRGSYNMIELATEYELVLNVVKYEQRPIIVSNISGQYSGIGGSCHTAI